LGKAVTLIKDAYLNAIKLFVSHENKLSEADGKTP